jgi:hypothetical protein
MNVRLSLLIGAAALCSSCAYKFTQTHAPEAAKPQDCFVEFLSTIPTKPYIELGVFEPDGDAANELRAFTLRIRPAACAVGADAVIAKVNGIGTYVQGVAIKYTEEAVK